MEEILKHRHLQEIKKIFISAAGKKAGHEAEAVKAGAYRSCRPNRGRTVAEQWPKRGRTELKKDGNNFLF